MSSIISGTHRPQDLIPAFLDAVEDLAPEEYAALRLTPFPCPPAYALEDEDSDWWDGPDCAWFLNEELWNILDSVAPDGHYFGAHPGDGSDFGFWGVG